MPHLPSDRSLSLSTQRHNMVRIVLKLLRARAIHLLCSPEEMSGFYSPIFAKLNVLLIQYFWLNSSINVNKNFPRNSGDFVLNSRIRRNHSYALLKNRCKNWHKFKTNWSRFLKQFKHVSSIDSQQLVITHVNLWKRLSANSHIWSHLWPWRWWKRECLTCHSWPHKSS